MRADARANRDDIVEAALEMFRARGDFEVSMRSIAAHAGVGVATLHRRFPDRESLITTVVDRLHRENLAIVEEHLAQWDADPEVTWRSVIHRLVATGIAPLATSGSEFALAEGCMEDFLQQMRERDLGPIEQLLEKAARHGLAPADLDPYRFIAGIVVLSRPLPELTVALLPDQGAWMVDVYIAGLKALRVG
ncbi:TetR/AcrR family transcriptional regulator [Brevibacterium album]|uniref:TetR/AcrR family transcriptional regulator n=1 Tax=Brevibacterium album TaxID=417948 RepID=UPI00040ECC17|nr:TetR/AcrR family transcriptional regulator [Brevibacterium album]